MSDESRTKRECSSNATARRIIKAIHDHQDTSEGINWDVIDCYLDEENVT